MRVQLANVSFGVPAITRPLAHSTHKNRRFGPSMFIPLQSIKHNFNGLDNLPLSIFLLVWRCLTHESIFDMHLPPLDGIDLARV